MKLIEIFDQLADGELVQISLGNGELPINSKDYGRIARSVNLGLTALHTRFLLKEGRLTLELQDDQETYILDRTYAVSNTVSSATKYILDSADPFYDTVLKVQRVLDDDGREFPFNDPDLDYSIREIDEKTLFIPSDIYEEYPYADTPVGGVSDNDTVVVVFHKGHRTLTEDDWESPEDCEIALPNTHLEALLYFVASRLMNPLGASREGNHEGNNYMARYEQACLRLEGRGMQIDRQYSGNKFRNRGWA